MLNTYGDRNNGKIETLIDKGSAGLTKIIIEYKDGLLTRITRQILNKRLEIIKEIIKEVHTDCDCVDGVLFYAKNSSEVDERDVTNALRIVRRLTKTGWDEALYDDFYCKCNRLERESGISSRAWLSLFEALSLLGVSDIVAFEIMRLAGVKVGKTR